jgi:hypothetical protein
MGGFDVIQGVFVAAVDERDGSVRVALRDGASDVGEITWTFGAGVVEYVAQLRAWLRSETPLAYVRRGDEVALIDERALLERAYAP